jgi:uncharacterized protein YndB with AHSA1/START domain
MLRMRFRVPFKKKGDSGMNDTDVNRVIRDEILVDASRDEVWAAWTTEGGITSFFAPACKVEITVDGAYEILFDPAAEPGRRGAEGCRVLAFQPKKMLAFTWNAPLNMPEVRKQWTHVVVRFEQVEAGKTRVLLWHDGWGQGPEWDEAFEYFVKAWNVVLFRLKYSFSTGPVDWDNPPRVT